MEFEQNYKRYGNRPYLIMMCGLPGSGKTTYAKNNITITTAKKTYRPIVLSSDQIRKEIYGDETIQGDGNKVFTKLHKKAKEELKQGNDVVIDATYIKKKHRIHFLKELKKIPCIPVCIVMATEYSLCILNNYSRNRKVPKEVIKRMLLNWQPPHYGEGFDKISYVFSYYNDFKLVHNKQKERYNFDTFYKVANVFDQENSHHKLTLGEHCAKAGEKIQELSPDNFWLLVGALLHDNGKIFTKTRNNIKGIDDGDCHYYQHHCVGAYNAMFYLHSFEDIKSNDIAYVTNLIYYHMHPYCEWKQSEKALNRDKQLLGTKLYDDIMLLHIADLFAH